MRIIIIFCLLIIVGAQAQAKSQYVMKASEISYTVTHPLHTVVGKSDQARGKIECDDKNHCVYLVAVPVKSFDSGSGNRDQHMLEVARAAINPMVAVKGEMDLPKEAGDLKLAADISFAGETKHYAELPLKVTKSGERWEVKGDWKLSFTDFKIERPELLKVAVKDEIKIQFQQTWMAQP